METDTWILGLTDWAADDTGVQGISISLLAMLFEMLNRETKEVEDYAYLDLQRNKIWEKTAYEWNFKTMDWMQSPGKEEKKLKSRDLGLGAGREEQRTALK